MEKGYYFIGKPYTEELSSASQSTIKMEKGYYVKAYPNVADVWCRNPQ